MRRAFAVLVCLWTMLAAATGVAQAERRVALVIGNGAYQHTSPLANPRNDAEDVAAALRRSDFETIVGTDLTQAEMQDITIRFARAAREADVAMFYYAGHAMQFAGTNYLMPVDARLTDEADLRRMVRVDEVLADLRPARSLRILVLDACRDNPLAEDLKRSMGRTRAMAVGRGLSRVDSPHGSIIAFATQAGAVADDGRSRNSPYTTAFLKHIETPAEIGVVFRRIAADVYAATGRQQTPELAISIIGDYYLRGRQAAGTSAAPPSQPAPAPAPPAPAPAGQNAAAAAWEAIKDHEDPEVFEAFLKEFPGGVYAALARARLRELREKKVAVGITPPEPAPAPVPAPAPAPPPQVTIKPMTRSVDLKVASAFAAQDEFHNAPFRAFAAEVERLSGGRMKISTFTAGEIVPAFQTLDAVGGGFLDGGFSIPSFSYGKNTAMALLGGTLPGGLSPERLAAWYAGEGQGLADRIYAKLKVKMLPCGIMGPKGGVWVRKPLAAANSLRGLKIRTVGLSTDLYRAAGATPVVLPGGEIVPALDRGVIDGVEFSRPLADHTLGLHRSAKNYYYPGWSEPAGIMDFYVGLAAWNAMPREEQEIIKLACRNVMASSLLRVAEDERRGLDLIRKASVTVRPFPDSVLAELRRAADRVIAEKSKENPDFRAVAESMRRFR